MLFYWVSCFDMSNGEVSALGGNTHPGLKASSILSPETFFPKDQIIIRDQNSRQALMPPQAFPSEWKSLSSCYNEGLVRDQ